MPGARSRGARFAAAGALMALGHLASAQPVFVQWQDASPERPWLRDVTLLDAGVTRQLPRVPLDPSDPEFPHGARVDVDPAAAGGSDVRVRLAGGYGFVVTGEM